MITDYFIIHIKRVDELDKKERLDINNLILENFEKSRLKTYEKVIYYSYNNNIIAFVGLYFINKYISLNQLCVHKNYRNNGLATNLLKIIDNLYIPLIPQILYIDKNKDTTNYLFNFYSKNGFKEIDYLKTLNLTYDKEVEYLMIKEI